MSEQKVGRPRQFDGSPISVRLSGALHDELSIEALRRGIDLAVVIRERLMRKRVHDYPVDIPNRQS